MDRVCPEKKIILASRRITSIDSEEDESWIRNVTVAEEESKCHMRRKAQLTKLTSLLREFKLEAFLTMEYKSH